MWLAARQELTQDLFLRCQTGSVSAQQVAVSILFCYACLHTISVDLSQSAVAEFRQAFEDLGMASTRADLVAQLLFELKRASKLATYSVIARKAGFSPGSNGRTMESCLKVVRRDWPHLHWWRAVRDDGPIEAEQEAKLREAGFELAVSPTTNKLAVVSIETHCMVWDAPAAATA